MNNTIKKIIGGIVTVVALALPAVSFAAVFNNDPLDFATLRVMNYTVNPTCTTCWGPTATANAGDVLSFAIYYHNTGPDIATNVRVRLTPQSTIAGTVHTFTATVSADNAPAVTGTATVTTTTSQTLSFSPGSVIWRPNQTVTGSTPLPLAQLPTDIFNGIGINLGSVAPGWATQGSVIVRFQTSVAVIPTLPTVTTNPATAITQTSASLNGFVTPNGASTNAWFEWGTTPAYGNSTVAVTYGLTATNYSNTITGLTAGTTYYYRAVAQNSQGIAYGAQMVFTTTGATISLPTVTTNGATAITQTSATLNGFVTPNGASTNAWFEWGTTPAYGNSTVAVTYGLTATNYSNTITGLTAGTTYYYRAVAQNSQGIAYGAQMVFTTTGATISLPTVTTNGATAITQTSATLNGFVTPNGASTNAWFEWGTTPAYGNSTVAVTYGLTATNYSNTITGLTAGTTYYYRAVAQNSQGIAYGAQMSFVATGTTWTIPSVSTRNADVSSTLAVLNGYVDPNFTSDTVRWFEWGATQSFGYTTTMLSHGTVASNFNATITGLAASTNYYYRAVARNSQGTVYGNTLSFTTTGQTTSTTIGSSPVATTLLATEITGTTATLNGLVFTSASQPSNAWFEWGASSLLGNKTQTVGVGMLPTVKHSDAITGLVQGQTYYYRIVAENPYGKVYGSIMSFVSEGSSVVTTTRTIDTGVVITTQRPAVTVVTKPTVTVVNRGSSVQSLVALSIDGGIEAIAGGDKRSYHVAWKNESAQSLRNVVLRVTFPQTMKFESSTSGTFSSADNTVTLDIKTLASGDAGEAFVTATADRTLKTGELLVVTANMVYTDASGIQGDAIAYMTHRAEATQSALGASIFGAGAFLPTTLLGWILLIALVLILVLLGNYVYGRLSSEPGH